MCLVVQSPPRLLERLVGALWCGDVRLLVEKEKTKNIAIYNMLLQTVVDEETVCGFQRCLQEMAKQEVAAGNDAWSNLLSPRIALYRHPLRALLSVQ